jgi:CHAD domain-containing protein
MRDLDDLFAALAKSRFRASRKLGPRDAQYLRDKGIDVVMDHARDFIDRRLAPAHVPNDGKQTPWRGHPVFVAQHATATCCRGCLSKWHAIAQGHELTPAQRQHVLQTLERWLRAQSA